MKYCKQTNFYFKKNHIHQLRISFKRLRALLRLQKNSKILRTDIKNIFSLAGEIRSVQLAMKMISESAVSRESGPKSLDFEVGSLESEVTNQLLLKFETLKKEWKSVYDKKVLTGLLSELKKSKTKPADYHVFFTDKINKLFHLIFADTITDTMLHDARKIAKDLEYVMEECKSDNVHLKLPEHFSLKTLKIIGKEIGSYNDRGMLILSLYKFKPPEDDPDALKKVYPLIAKKLLDKSEQKKKLITRLQSIIESSR